MPINDICSLILTSLQKEMRPLLSPGQIDFCTPDKFGEGCMLGLTVYNIARDEKFQMSRNIVVDGGLSTRPPICVKASIMLTPYIGKKSSLIEDYKILDRILQIWHDNSKLPYISPLQPSFVPQPYMELQSLSMDEIAKIWQFPGVPYRASLFYTVAPIAVPSAVEVLTTRVKDASFSADEQGKGS